MKREKTTYSFKSEQRCHATRTAAADSVVHQLHAQGQDGRVYFLCGTADSDTALLPIQMAKDSNLLIILLFLLLHENGPILRDGT